MLISFFQTLKNAGIPVSIKEYLIMLEALNARIAFASVDDFYLLSRTCLVKDEKYFDRFDRAFSAWFSEMESIDDVRSKFILHWERGIELISAADDGSDWIHLISNLSNSA